MCLFLLQHTVNRRSFPLQLPSSSSTVMGAGLSLQLEHNSSTLQSVAQSVTQCARRRHSSVSRPLITSATEFTASAATTRFPFTLQSHLLAQKVQWMRHPQNQNECLSPAFQSFMSIILYFRLPIWFYLFMYTILSLRLCLYLLFL